MLEKMTKSFKNFSGARDLGKFESFSDRRRTNLKIINEFYFSDFQKTIQETPLAAHSISSPALYGKKLFKYISLI